MQPTIRPIEDRDIEIVVALWDAAGVSRPWNDPVWEIAFARSGPHSTVLVAEAAGSVVATAMIGEDGHRGWIYYLAASPDRHGQGLGRAMMEAAEAWLAGRGVRRINLLIRNENAAVQGFYTHLGYRDTDTVCFQKVLDPGKPE